MCAKIYHNPRCSKSRQTLQLLQGHGVDPEIVEYLKTPPTAGELQTLLGQLGLEPRQLMRKQEEPYKTLQLDNPGLSSQDLIAAMVANPVLIERPIVVINGKAAIGRPPENILTLLTD